ncbi:helix-turn-helix domain-containing protein [Paenibacillus larvae]
MSELGQFLRNARLEKKLSLEELQEMTKIRVRYLEAIEEGDYKVLPGSFYVRAFIKSYAEAMGLDPNEVLDMYQKVNPVPEEPEHALEPLRPRSRSGGGPRSSDQTSKWASTVMVVCFVALIVGIVYFFAYQGSSGSTGGNTPEASPNRLTEKQSESPSPSSSPEASATPQPTPTPTPTPEASLKQTETTKSLDTYTVSGTNKLEIELKAKDKVWYQIDQLLDTKGTKKKLIKTETLGQGLSASYTVEGGVFINVGKQNSIEVTVNGQKIDLGNASNPKKVKFLLESDSGLSTDSTGTDSSSNSDTTNSSANKTNSSGSKNSSSNSNSTSGTKSGR